MKETIRVLESPLANRNSLRDAILTGEYRKPFVGEDSKGRSLYLSLDCVQSRMRLDDPWALDLLYTRKAMSFLLFQSEPRNILILGLGGGSLAKYCLRHLPAAHVESVEIDADVISLGEYFYVPPCSRRFKITHGDAADFIAQTSQDYDVIIADAFDGRGVAPSSRGALYYEQVRSRLREGGIMVANFAGDRMDRLAHLKMMARAFAGNVLLVPVEGEGNEIALGFNGGAPPPDWKIIRDRAPTLRRTHGLDFPRFVGRLERSYKLGYMQRGGASPGWIFHAVRYADGRPFEKRRFYWHFRSWQCRRPATGVAPRRARGCRNRNGLRS